MSALSNLGLFDESDPALPDACPHCGSAVKYCAVDTGTPMRVVPAAGGPYVMDGDLLRFVSNDGYVLLQGHSDRRGRKVAKNEVHYASHFYECPKRQDWAKL